MTIDYAGLKTIFGFNLPESHIFFATVAANRYVPSYAAMRKGLGMSPAHTNRAVWKKFVEQYYAVNDEVPGVPTLKIVAGSASVNYTITDGVNNGSPIIQYHIYWTSASGNGTYGIHLDEKTGTIPNLVSGTEYTFQLTATNRAGESARTVAIKATPTA